MIEDMPISRSNFSVSSLEAKMDTYRFMVLKEKAKCIDIIEGMKTSSLESIFKVLFSKKGSIINCKLLPESSHPGNIYTRTPAPRLTPDVCSIDYSGIAKALVIEGNYYCGVSVYGHDPTMDENSYIAYNSWWLYWYNKIELRWFETRFVDSVFIKEYTGILLFLLLAQVIAFLIIVLSYFLSVQIPDSDKLRNYECGFEPYEDARNKFDVKFCLVAILFIIFDIEIIFLIPWVTELAKLPSIAFWVMMEFLFELVVAGLYVWLLNALRWV